MTALKKWRANKKYAAKLNLIKKIHRAIDPVIAAKIKANEF